MAIVNATDTRIINTSEDVIDAYCCAGKDAMTGVEVEICFFDPDKPDLPIMSPAQNKTVMDIAVAKHGSGAFNNEPASDLLEANSIPAKFEDLQTVFTDIQNKLQTLTDESKKIGLKRSYFQDMPQATTKNLLQNIVEVERYQAFFNPPREDFMDVAAYFTATKSTQVSISYINYEHMLANVRRLYLLAPFLFMLTDNTSGFDNTKPFPGHHGMHHRSSMGDRGGFPCHIFTAQNGEQYIESHINQVMTNPMYVYYDEDGILQQLPSGTWWTFDKDLREKGLNTAANYYLAQSILWPDVKIASLPSATGEITNHRYEARMFGVGIHQAQTALLITAGLAFDEEFAAKIDRLLFDFELCTKNAEKCITLLRKAYDDAKNHNGKFFDIPYGSGNMADFAKQFGKILEQSFTCDTYRAPLTPTLHICETGWTDAKVNRALFPTLEAIKTHQKTYDETIFENPNTCAHMLYSDKLKAAA